MKKDIKYNSNYMVTTTGQVYSKHRNRYLKLQKTNGRVPYYTVKLLNHASGKYEHFLVHRLVAETFIPNPSNLPQVNHINCNYHDNNINNLEWVTNRENTIHAYDNNLSGQAYITRVYKNGHIIGSYRSLRDACCILGFRYKTVWYHKQGRHEFKYNEYTFKLIRGGDKQCLGK